MAYKGRIDHIGSLLRPKALIEARQRILGVHDADTNLGPHDNAELTKIEDGYIRDVVALQESVGMPYVTDGEFRRRSWWTDFVLSFSGTRVSYTGNSPLRFVNAAGDERPVPGTAIDGRIRWRKSPNVAAFAFLKSAAKTAIPKVTIPGPPIVHYMRDSEIDKAIYPSLDQLWSDIVAAYRTEIKALGDAGLTHLQIDECMMAWLCDPRHRAWAKGRGDDPDFLIAKYAELIDQAISERPKNMTVFMHMCRGNMNAYWGGAGGYDPVADAIFNKIRVDGYLLEYDTPRAGDFRPLRLVPKGRQVYLGLVSTKDLTLESVDSLMRRIEEAAKHIPIAQLGLCPQCGFSTNVFGTQFTVDDERRKLELLHRVAERVWTN